MQWLVQAEYYRENASLRLSEQFIERVDEALDFIAENPMACSLYDVGNSAPDLQKHGYRKWPLQQFPHSIFFRVDETIVFVDALYAQRENILKHLKVQE